MLALFFTVGWHVVKWAFVAAAVLTYCELGPGGQALEAIVDSMVAVMRDVAWSELVADVMGHVQTLLVAAFEALQDNPIEVEHLAQGDAQ